MQAVLGGGYGLLGLSQVSHRLQGTKQLMFPLSTMRSRKSRQKMLVPENNGKTKGRLLFYDEIRKLHVPDQTAQDINVAQHTGKSIKLLVAPWNAC